MSRDKGRMDLKKDIRSEVEHYVSDPLKWDLATYALLAAVLAHVEAAYKRGEVAERSRAGYRKIKEGA